MTAIQVRRANLDDTEDAAAIVMLLDAYATDPRGGGQSLPEDVRARMLLNIHDLAVLPGHRGRGVGHALLTAAQALAAAEDCCRLTLEVQEDNTPARRLYERFGFRDVRYGDSGPTRFLGKNITA